jgi:hypothetical protein
VQASGDESKGFASRMAHEESRLPHSAGGRFCYNRWTEKGATLPRSHGRVSLAGSAPALSEESGRAREEMHRQCTAQLNTIQLNIR